MNDVELLATYELDSVDYSVRWGQPKQKFKATIIIIDTEKNCLDKLESITQYAVDNSLAAKISKKQAPKVIESLSNDNREICQIELMKSQISNQENKIKELESVINEQRENIKKLAHTNEELIKKANNKDKDLDHCNSQNLMSIATCIFNNYGSLADVQNLLLMNSCEQEDNTVIFYFYSSKIN
jgi:uncharacterized coiled-coil protein SlyX